MQEFDPHVLDEKAVPPPEEFRKRAQVRSLEQYREMYDLAERDPEGFWGELAKTIDWFEPPTKVLEWDLPHAKWFTGGKLNVSYNCLDRHLDEKCSTSRRCFGKPKTARSLQFTYAELHDRVCRFANALNSLGVKPGDCVTIYLPMIPELPIAMLACARIGAVHSVIFGGFSATALVDRIGDAKSKILITADGGFRRGKIVPLKETADAALRNCPTIEKSIVVRRTGEEVGWQEGRDLWWHDLEKAIFAGVRRGTVRFRASALYSLYQRHHGKAQGRAAHFGRLLAPNDVDARVWSSICMTTMSTGAPPISAG